MKQLSPITVGAYTFTASAKAEGNEGVVSITVTCGADAMTRKMNHAGAHDATPEQFEKDVIRAAEKIATELAGRIRSRELARNFTSF
jgi:hypothetical protein